MAVPAFLHPFARPAKDDFVSIVRGEGALVWDADGREYVDAMASLWYVNVGHGRGEVADAVAAQLRRLAAYSCFDPFTNPPADALAERLAALAPMPDARVFLTGSGSESVDTAIKLARVAQVQAGHPERTMVISRTFAYHGVTYGGLSAQGLPPNQSGFGPLLEGFLNVPNHDLEAVANALAANEGRVAAVITEPVQGAGGVRPPVDGYLAGLRRLCDQHGAFLIVDEVICGFGRLGTWWGSDFYGVAPDLVTFAKGVTAGYVPLGGVLVGGAVRAPLEADPSFWLRHGFTYSGHAGAAAAGHAVLDILEREHLLDRARHVGKRLEDGLRSLERDGLVREVRGEVAVWAVALPDGHDPIHARDHALAGGVITRAVGADTLTFCPPLVTTDQQVDRIVDTLAASLMATRPG